MPTGGRPHFVRQAIVCFQSQTYPAKELVIVDDGDDGPFELANGVRYERVRRMPLGLKRNYACSIARGEIICHWDDDDWSDPLRIEQQVTLLLKMNAQLTGYSSMAFARETRRQAWAYFNKPDYALGTSFCYRTEFWEHNPFPPVYMGEDAAFLREARAAIIEGPGMMVARVHADNTSTNPRGEFFTPMPYDELPPGFLNA